MWELWRRSAAPCSSVSLSTDSRSDLLETVAAERESVDSDTLDQGAAERRHSSHIEAPILTRSEDQVTVLSRVE